MGPWYEENEKGKNGEERKWCMVLGSWCWFCCLPIELYWLFFCCNFLFCFFVSQSDGWVDGSCFGPALVGFGVFIPLEQDRDSLIFDNYIDFMKIMRYFGSVSMALGVENKADGRNTVSSDTRQGQYIPLDQTTGVNGWNKSPKFSSSTSLQYFHRLVIIKLG